MIIDGVAATQGVDKSSERLIIENCDLSSVEAGEATWLWEHKKADQSTPLDVIGSVRFAKKVFSETDCDSDRERYWWNIVHQPFIYVIIRIYDGAGHPGAQAVAAQIRDHYANGEKIVVRHSIDGSTLARDGNVLTATIFRHLASTIQPCNAACDTGVLSDPVLEQMKLGKSEREIASCVMALECLPGEGPLLDDPSLSKSELPDLSLFVQPVTEALVSIAARAARTQLRKRLDLHDAALHTPAGPRPLYIPSRHSDAHAASFQTALADPRVRKLHDRAVEGWRRAHEQLRDGTLPRAQVEHALRFIGARPVAPTQVVQKAEWSLLDRLRKSQDELDPVLVNQVHELVTRRRDDCRGTLDELAGKPTVRTITKDLDWGDGRIEAVRVESTPPLISSLDPRRTRLLLALLGHGQCLLLDSALAQHLFFCSLEDAQTCLAALRDESHWRAAEDAYREHDAANGGQLDVLPASWQHWLVAPAHGQCCGLEIGGDRSGLLEVGLPCTAAGPYRSDQTAELHREWDRRFGTVGGALLFFAFLYPALQG